MDLEIKFIYLEAPTRELVFSYFKNGLPLSGNWSRIAALVWRTWSDEEAKGCLWALSTVVINGAKMSQADHPHFWNVFQALSNYLGREQGTIYTLSARRENTSHACHFHVVNFAKVLPSIHCGNIEKPWWHIHGLFS